MRCPKYIRDKIHRRAEYARKFNDLDMEIAEWISSRGIDCEYALPGYVEALCGEYKAAEDTIRDIENWEGN